MTTLSDQLFEEAEELDSGLQPDLDELAKLLREAGAALRKNQPSEVLVRVATELLAEFSDWSDPVRVTMRPVEGRDPMGATHEMIFQYFEYYDPEFSNL